MAQLESVVAEAKTAYDAEVAAIADSEAQVKQLAKQVKETMEGRVKGPKSHVDRLEKQISKINGDITKTNVAIKTAGRNIVASEEKIESIKKDIVESKERETQLRAELEALTTEAREMIENKEAKSETKKEMKTTLHDLKKEIDKMEKVETDLKAKQQVRRLKRTPAGSRLVNEMCKDGVSGLYYSAHESRSSSTPLNFSFRR